MFDGGEGGEVEESTHAVGKDANDVLGLMMRRGEVVVEGEGERGGGDDDGCEKEKKEGGGGWWNGLISVSEMCERQGVAKDASKKTNSR
jgi:hypothetical protein